MSRLILALVGVLAVAGVVGAHAPTPEPPRSRGLAGTLLVATDSLRDPRFVRTVIYMVRHDPSGALGLVVNRPLGTTPLARLLDNIGRSSEGVGGTIPLHYGGPVEPKRGFVLHTPEWTSEDSRVIQAGVAFTTDPAIFEAIARGAGPRRLLVALGYAGWSPGQLEGEIAGGAWITVTADEALIFDEDAASKWDRAMARRKITL
ncbi:MAG: YqgE/AlgH family protein [Candidatus Rokuibacteriota bacterium]